MRTKISKQTHQILKQVSKKTGKLIKFILGRAVELYRQRQFFKELNRQVLAAKTNPKVWAEELRERKLWEGTLSDGLDNEG